MNSTFVNVFLKFFKVVFGVFGLPILVIFTFRFVNNKGPLTITEIGTFISEFSAITFDNLVDSIKDLNVIINKLTDVLPNEFGQIAWGGWDLLGDILEAVKLIGKYISTGFEFLVQLPKMVIFLVKDIFSNIYVIFKAFLRLCGTAV